jgi:AGZA family xanthine/uracil permease-like MFS transporter
MAKISRKVPVSTEITAGITTFFTMAYIVVVNPAILSTEGTGMPFSGVLTATVLLAFLMTLLMGVYAKLPFAVAPGMGINAFFTYSIVLGQGVPWQQALGAVFWSGVLFLAISLTPLREAIAKAIPRNLRIASATGIGLFITFIGLKNGGLVAANPVTLVQMGKLEAPALLTILGIAISVVLLRKRSPLAFLGTILSITVIAALMGRIPAPQNYFSLPDFESVLFKLDILGSLKLSLAPAILSILFTDLFDSISTFIGVSHATGMVDAQGHPIRVREGLIVDAWATLTAGLFGTSSGTAYIESAAGIEAGGRTGMTSVVTALCFIPCFFIAPLAGLVPGYATAPVLILVGAMMFKSVSALKLDKLEDMVPSFLSIVLIPLTFSITQGILWGFISHVALYFAVGRRKEIHPMMYGVAAMSVLLLIVENN